MSDGTLFSAVLRRLPRSVLLAPFLASIFLYPQPAHAQDASSSPTLPGSLRGTVVNSVTREPVARALVSSPDSRLADFTDDDGHFEFQPPRIEANPNSPAGGLALRGNSVQLMARKPGFLESGFRPYDSQNSTPDDIAIYLTPEAFIVGRVNLPFSNQSDRITVQLYRREVRDGRVFWVSAGIARTRSNGEFRMANLPAGIYKIFTNEMLDRDPTSFDPTGQLYGYPPLFYPAAGDFASGSPITLEAGKTFQAELSPVLQPYYAVKISTPNFQTDGGMEVSVALQGHKGPGYSLGYGSGGIGGELPNGTYTVEAKSQQGRGTSTGIVNITVNGAPLVTASMAIVPNGSIPVNINDEVSADSHHSAGSISVGRFTREAKAGVLLQPADEFDLTGFASLRPPLKANDNDLVLESVGPGRYWLKVDPYRGYVASAVSGSTDLLRQPLVVGPGGASLPIDIVLRDDSAEIEGTVGGMPPSHATAGGGSVPMTAYVYCVPLPDSPGRFTVSTVAADGTFQLQLLPPGVYRVLAFDRPQGELEYQNPEAMAVYEGQGPVVRLAPGQIEQVHVTLISTKE